MVSHNASTRLELNTYTIYTYTGMRGEGKKKNTLTIPSECKTTNFQNALKTSQNE